MTRATVMKEAQTAINSLPWGYVGSFRRRRSVQASPLLIFFPAQQAALYFGAMPAAAAKTESRKKSAKADFAAVFRALRDILNGFVGGELDVQTDVPGNFHLEIPSILHRGKPLYFAGVCIGKNYVSFYLMSVYYTPELREVMSPELTKRMQGKACFNFSALDPECCYPGHGTELAEGPENVLAFFHRLHQESMEIFGRLSSDDLQKKCVTPGGAAITVWKWLRAMVEHEVHHRAQIYVYLGMLGLPAPPIYGLTSEEVRERSRQVEY